MNFFGKKIEFDPARSTELDPYIEAADSESTEEKMEPPARLPRRSRGGDNSLSTILTDARKSAADMHRHGGPT